MTALLCVGHSALDTIYNIPEIPTTPTKVLATACIESGGGMAANASVAASRLGGDPGQGLQHAQRLVRGVVGVTLEAEGLLWLEEGREHRAAAPRVSAVDTLAAGDVFHGAFALAIGEGNTVTDAARFANTAAALKCTRFGGSLGAPARAEVDAFLRAQA